jgi:RNA polymerase sigma factor (sigma-70 family)
VRSTIQAGRGETINLQVQPLSDPSEDIAELLARVREGDEGAVAELLRRYEPKIRLTARYLLRPILRRYLDSIDVSQSVQFHLMSGLRGGRFDLPDSETFVALAVTLVRRKVAQHWRHLQREHSLRFGVSGGERNPESPLAPPFAPVDPALAVEQGDDLRRLMQVLDPTERRLVELRMQGHSTEAAAIEMGCAANVLRVRLSRLRKRLQEQGYLADWL